MQTELAPPSVDSNTLPSVFHVAAHRGAFLESALTALGANLAAEGHAITTLKTWSAAPGVETAKHTQHIPSTLGYARGLRQALRQNQAELIHLHGLSTQSLLSLSNVLKTRKIPVFASPYSDLRPGRRIRAGINSLLLRSPLGKCVSAWVVFDKIDAHLVREMGFEGPVCQISRGVTAPIPNDEAIAHKYWIERCPECKDRPTALFFSKFHHQKRVLELVDAWSAVAPRDWILLIAGQPLEYSAEDIRDYIIRHGNGGTILVEESFDAPPPLSLASIVLHPAMQEYGASLIPEALIRGIPVLVTEELGWGRLNEEDFAWSGPWDDFQATLKQALQLNPEVLRERGAKARVWAERELSWTKSARALSDFYRTILR